MRVSISRTIVCTFPRRRESERCMQLAFLAPNLVSLCRWWYQSAFRVFDARRCISLTRDPRLKLPVYYLIFCCNRHSYLRTPGEDSVALKCFISTRERRVVLRAHVNSPRSHAAVLFQTETLDFIPPDLWSPNLPDLTDHNIWRVTQRKAYTSKQPSWKNWSTHLWKNAENWRTTFLEMSFSNDVSVWRCVSGSGHFEHKLCSSRTKRICHNGDVLHCAIC